LGYYIVKNRGPSDINLTLEEGQKKERIFFAKSPWSVLAHTGRAGVDCLKIRVRELLINLIKKEFPKLKIDAAKELATVRAQRDKMGPSRSSQHTQRAYLNRMSETFQSLVRDALNANYTGNNILSDHHDLRLITRVVETNEAYADEMKKNGHMRPFARNEDNAENKDNTPELSGTLIQDWEENSLSGTTTIMTSNATELENFDEIQEILDQGDLTEPASDERGDIMSYIEEVYKSSRGQELGTVSFASYINTGIILHLPLVRRRPPRDHV
jgi:hypothetical protein